MEKKRILEFVSCWTVGSTKVEDSLPSFHANPASYSLCREREGREKRFYEGTVGTRLE